MRKSIISIFIMGILLASVLGIGPVVSEPVEKIPVIVGFEGMPDAALIKSHGGDIKYEYKIIRAIACSLPEKAIDALKKNSKIEYVELDSEVHIIQETLPWGVDRIDAELVHAYNKGTGVKVAIIDTGIDYTHPDLDANYKGGYDFVNKDADPKDDHGHGTHCAGIVAAENNGIGVVGVAPEAWIYAVKVLNQQGSGYLSDVIAGIQWSVNNGMQVVSMSLGTSTYSASLEDACNNAYKAGLVLVAAAGNSGDGNPNTNEYSYPAAYNSVIAVGATTNTDTAPSWSNSGPYLELAAPGVSIYSTLPTYTVTLSTTYGYNYGTLSGTSMACPHVTGTAALIIASDPTLTNVNVRTRLQTTADDLGVAGRDTVYGYGLVDADEASGTTAPPPAEAEKTYWPQGVIITKGTVSSGDYTSLFSDDAVYFAVKSARVGFTQVIDWYAYVKISGTPSAVTSLTVTYDGKYSTSRTQTLYIYNFASDSWEKIDSRTISKSDTKIIWSITSPASYISTGGEIRLRVYASATSSFTCYADFVSYTIKYST